jgi:hypothetical protein
MYLMEFELSVVHMHIINISENKKKLQYFKKVIKL